MNTINSELKGFLIFGIVMLFLILLSTIIEHTEMKMCMEDYTYTECKEMMKGVEQ